MLDCKEDMAYLHHAVHTLDASGIQDKLKSQQIEADTKKAEENEKKED